MCIKSYQHYTRCDHVTTTLTNCPAYHKQQESTCIGGLFRQSSTANNCGKVVPHHLENQTYCQNCLIKRDHLSAQRVGQGALKASRQGFQDIFLEENKEAARSALQKSEKSRHRRKGSNHEVIHVENSVWLSDLYHHPETLAKKETYAREAAHAPPVSSSSRSAPSQRRTQATNSSPETMTKLQKRQTEKSRKPDTTRRDLMLTYGNSQPPPRPAPPMPTYSRDANTNKTSRLPSTAPLPLQQHSHSHNQQHELKHKSGRVYNSTKSRNPPPVASYQGYLDDVTESFRAGKQRPTCAPPPHHRAPVKNQNPNLNRWEEEPSRWDARKASLSKWIDKHKDKVMTLSHDNHSDLSFVCETSRAISHPNPASHSHERQKQKPKERRR
ncbi:hypothetical protein F4777DRAFT_251610 [Nemania sp. FL0916]|nr:hypothetical protein F4777DRAFT_251610 [Nemania sp. FL0916]